MKLEITTTSVVERYGSVTIPQGHEVVLQRAEWDPARSCWQVLLIHRAHVQHEIPTPRRSP